MKAIVVRQPWATLIALGIKTIETRPGPPNGPMRPDGVRGLPGLAVERGERIAIVAGATMGVPSLTRVGDAQVFRRLDGDWDIGHPPISDDGLTFRGLSPLPLGAVVCTVVVNDALPVFNIMQLLAVDTGDAPWPNLQVNGPDTLTRSGGVPMDDQLPLGDFTPGRWGWMLSDPRPCDPVPCKGRQGVFELPVDLDERSAR